MATIAIVSSVLSNRVALQDAIDDARCLGATEYICLGNTIGPGGAHSRVLQEVRRWCLVLRGEHDSSEPKRSGFNAVAARAARLASAVWDLRARDRAYLALLPREAVRAGVLYTHSIERTHNLDWTSGSSECALQEWQNRLSTKYRHCFVAKPELARVVLEDLTVVNADACGFSFRLRAKHRYLISPGALGAPRGASHYGTYLLYDGNWIRWRRIDLKEVPPRGPGAVRF